MQVMQAQMRVGAGKSAVAKQRTSGHSSTLEYSMTNSSVRQYVGPASKTQ
jgi:hypothetical protein